MGNCGAYFMKYILFAGKKQVGKSTSATICGSLIEGTKNQDCWENTKIVSFAEALKESVSRIFNIPSSVLNGSDEDKNKNSHIAWGDFKWASMKKFGQSMYSESSLPMTYRELMQYFGEMMRDQINPLLWVDSVFYNPQEDQKRDVIKIVQDLRYLNELEAGIKCGGLPILVKRDTGFVDHHASEQIEKHENLFKYVIDNNGSMDNLTKQIAEILKTEGVI